MLDVSVVVPAYNEEKRLPSSLAKIVSYLRTGPAPTWEVVVVDDGSTDRTAQCVQAAASAESRIRLLANPGNRGKGYAVRNGMLHASGEWILYTDADLSAPMQQLTALLEEAGRQQAAIAIGSRALDRSLIGVRQPAFREHAGRFFNWTMRQITGLPFRDTQCGFKLYHSSAVRTIFQRQRLDGFGFDVEDLYIAKLHGIVAIEVPVKWDNVEGTKVSMIRGIDAYLDPLRIRWHALLGHYR